jgi:MinD-like ATPase involved in chromosome partitioning or flagellar assembly
LAAVPAHSQRIVVVSAAGGAGRSVVTAGIGLVVASHRDWPVAVLDAAEQPFSALGARLGAPSGPTLSDAVGLLDQPGAGTRLRQQVRVIDADVARTGGRPRSGPGSGARPGGVHLFAGPEVGQRRLSPQALVWVLARLGWWYPTVVADAPAGVFGPHQHAALAGAGGVVVVVRARAEEVRRTAAAVAALRRAVPGLLGGPVVGVVVAARPGRWCRAAAAAEAVLGGQCAHVVRVPWDPVLAAGGPVRQAGRGVWTAVGEVAAGALALAGPDVGPLGSEGSR